MLTSLLFHRFGIDHGITTKKEYEKLPENLLMVKQVHGNKIYEPSEVDIRKWNEGNRAEPQGYDAIMTDQRGISIGVKTADCLPVLIVDYQLKRVAVVHAGWRGTVARITEKTVDQFLSFGSHVGNLLVVLGPSISGSCYEVEHDVEQIFQKEFPNFSVLKQKTYNKWLLDVREANRQQLLQKGVLPQNIDVIDLCTHCRPDLFYSYRRDGANTGRMVSYMSLGK